MASPSQMKPKKVSREFTLIELLLVISIIAILSAILLPSIHKARETAYKITCQSQLKQLATASLAYASDYREHLPPTQIKVGASNVYWTTHMETVLGVKPAKKILTCPVWKKGTDPKDPTDTDSYANNRALAGSYNSTNGQLVIATRLSKVKEPSRVLMLCDGELGIYQVAQANPINPNRVIAIRHNFGTNIIFLDTHTYYTVPNYSTGLRYDNAVYKSADNYAFYDY